MDYHRGSLSFSEHMKDSFCNISQFISSEPEPFHFPPFSVEIYSSPHSGQDDVLSDSYNRVIEHALWKRRAPSAACSSLASLPHCEGEVPSQASL